MMSSQGALPYCRWLIHMKSSLLGIPDKQLDKHMPIGHGRKRYLGLRSLTLLFESITPICAFYLIGAYFNVVPRITVVLAYASLEIAFYFFFLRQFIRFQKHTRIDPLVPTKRYVFPWRYSSLIGPVSLQNKVVSTHLFRVQGRRNG